MAKEAHAHRVGLALHFREYSASRVLKALRATETVGRAHLVRLDKQVVETVGRAHRVPRARRLTGKEECVCIALRVSSSKGRRVRRVLWHKQRMVLEGRAHRVLQEQQLYHGAGRASRVDPGRRSNQTAHVVDVRSVNFRTQVQDSWRARHVARFTTTRILQLWLKEASVHNAQPELLLVV